jgi:hypothetical protein
MERYDVASNALHKMWWFLTDVVFVLQSPWELSNHWANKVSWPITFMGEYFLVE